MDQSRSAMATDGLNVLLIHKHSFGQIHCECYFHVHVVDLCEHYFLIFLNSVSRNVILLLLEYDLPI